MSKSHCQFLNPLQRDGTSQNQRLLDMVLPEAVPVDDRSLADMLIYVHKFAALLRFYNIDNEASGDWVDFIQQDVSAAIALITVSDFKGQKKEFERAREEVEKTQDLPAFSELLQISFTLARQLDSWYGVSREGLFLHTSLGQLINSAVKESLQELVSWSLDAVDANVPFSLPDLTTFNEIWGELTVVPAKNILSAPPTSQQLESAVSSISKHFDQLYKVVAVAVEQSGVYLEESLEKYPEHQPHMALLLAFLQLFRYAQEHLNSLSEKHLQFYYEEILQLQRKPEKPDQVHLVFELAQQVNRHRLAKDQLFKAGKDAGGTNLFYASDDELVINQAKLHSEHGLKTVFIQKKSEVEKLYAAPYANSSDGVGGAITDEEGKWPTFGSVLMPEAKIGFAVSSSMMLLAEGVRDIYVKFSFSSFKPLLAKGRKLEDVADDLKKNLRLFVSGEKDWIPVSLDSLDISDEKIIKDGGSLKPIERDSGRTPLDSGFSGLSDRIRFPKSLRGVRDSLVEEEALVTEGKSGIAKVEPPFIEFHIQLQPEDAPIVAYADKVLNDGFSTTQPVMKCLLAQGSGEKAHVYEYLRNIDLQSLEIRVEVSGVKSLILENDLGILNPAKPFHPFGPIPKKGSKLYIGSNEVFQKSLQEVTVNLSWGDLPEENFNAHYSTYKRNNQPIVQNNNHFKATLTQLHNGQWVGDENTDLEGKKQPQERNLFQTENGAIGGTNNFTCTKQVSKPKKVAHFDRYGVQLQYGFLRFELQTSFLHSLYPKILADAVSVPVTDAPKLPYTPLITELTVGYSASETTDYERTKEKGGSGGDGKLFHIAPFGQVQFVPNGDSIKGSHSIVDNHLVPDFPVAAANNTIAEGTLYIGIEKLNPPESFSVLFQVAEGSGDPTVTEIPDVFWSYMVNNKWVLFEKKEIVRDKTNGLLTSGIITFAIPAEITADNSVMPSGLHWIKASVELNARSIAKIIGVLPQAVTARFRNQSNNLSHLDSVLPGSTISKLKKRDGSIKKISQPFASFGGKLPERDEPFYIRVSERLRHKGRAITIFDYERLVLEQFPDIYKVKCINHARGSDEFSPGSVQLVVVPDLRNKNGIDPFRPRASVNTLKQIGSYVSDLASDFVTVEVSNPSYEEIEVFFKVAFHPGYDQGLYLSELEQAIIKFLSPWLYDDVSDISFGGRIHRTWILQHVERQEYVDYVTDFRMNQYTEVGVNRLDVEEAIVQSSASVLVSSKKHKIEIADNVACEKKKISS